MMQAVYQPAYEMGHSLRRHPMRYGMLGVLCLSLGVFIVGPTMAYVQKPAVVTVTADLPLTEFHGDQMAVLPLMVIRNRASACQGNLQRVLWRWKPNYAPPTPETLFQWEGHPNLFNNMLRYQVDLSFPAWIAALPGVHYSSYYERQCSIWSYWFPSHLRQAADILVPVTEMPVSVKP